MGYGLKNVCQKFKKHVENVKTTLYPLAFDINEIIKLRRLVWKNLLESKTWLSRNIL